MSLLLPYLVIFSGRFDGTVIIQTTALDVVKNEVFVWSNAVGSKCNINTSPILIF